MIGGKKWKEEIEEGISEDGIMEARGRWRKEKAQKDKRGREEIRILEWRAGGKEQQ